MSNILIPKSHWKQTLTLYPWGNTLNRIYLSSDVPSFSGSDLYLISDYSGGHKSSKYDAITFLVFDLIKSTHWEYKRQIIRKKVFRGSRRMSFKNLNDSQRRRALPYFLDAANDFYGICTTFIISKKIKSLCSLPAQVGILKNAISLKVDWKYKQFENAMRIIHFFCILVAGLSHEKQNINWISDEDSLFANMTFANDITDITSRFTNFYVRYPLGELGIGTTKLDEGDFKTEDLTIIPDLVAGAMAETATKIADKYTGHIPIKMAFSAPENLSKKTMMIIDWLAFDSDSLKKSIITFDLYEDNKLGVQRILIT